MEEEKDVKAEDTATDSSAENNTAAGQPNDSEVEKTQEEAKGEQDKTVPYSRLQEVIKERNAYKKLIETKQELKVEEPKPTEQQEESIEEALKIVDKRIKSQLGDLESKIELRDTASKFPDFYKYADQIKDLIKENPNTTWENAYKIAKFDVIGTEAFKAGKQQLEAKVAEKKAANVESAVKAKTTVKAIDEIDPMAKGPDGKYLYSLSELESILPKS